MKSRIVTSCAGSLAIVMACHLPMCSEASASPGLGTALAVPSLLAMPGAFDTASHPRDSLVAPESLLFHEPPPSAPVAITLRNIGNGEVATFAISTDGQVDQASAPTLQHFLRCRRTKRERPIAPGVLAMLVSVAQHWPGREIDIVSAFRAPPFGAPHSKHFTGHAIDLRVEGVKTSKLRDFIWREHHDVGVGYYLNEDFVHMDWRPGEGDMAWSSDSEGDSPDYNPRWARLARRVSQRHGCSGPCS